MIWNALLLLVGGPLLVGLAYAVVVALVGGTVTLGLWPVMALAHRLGWVTPRKVPPPDDPESRLLLEPIPDAFLASYERAVQRRWPHAA